MPLNVKLTGTGIETTSLGYGCAGLMRLVSSRARQAVLNEAYDLGIRHFDVARMYGLGKVEEQVGKFIRGRRDKVTLTTKFGIELKPAAGMAAVIQIAGRLAIRLMPSLRKVAQRKVDALYAPRNYGAAAARRSLEESLSALDTDYVDLFMLHEPIVGAVQYEDILEYLEHARDQGLIRAWGVAGYPDQLMPIFDFCPRLAPVLQLPNDVLNRQLQAFRDYLHTAFITFSPYSEALHRIDCHLERRPELARLWSDEMGTDVGNLQSLASLLLAYGLNTNTSGIVLFSSTRKEGVRVAAKTWSRQIPSNVTQRLAKLVAAETKLVPANRPEGVESEGQTG